MNTFWQDLKTASRRVFHRGKASMETLAENIDRQAAMQRLAQQKKALVREYNDLFMRIGKKVYTLHVRGKVRNRDVLGDCRRIDELREQIRGLMAEMDAIRLRAMGDPGDERLEDESVLAEEEDATLEAEAPSEESEVASAEAPAVAPAAPAPEPETSGPEPD